jgi:sulfur-carrier protein
VVRIEVKLYGTLRKHRPSGASGAPHHPFTLSLPPGATVAGLAASLGIPDGYVSAAAVNGEAADVATTLHDGDAVGLFPPSAGG